MFVACKRVKLLHRAFHAGRSSDHTALYLGSRRIFTPSPNAHARAKADVSRGCLFRCFLRPWSFCPLHSLVPQTITDACPGRHQELLHQRIGGTIHSNPLIRRRYGVAAGCLSKGERARKIMNFVQMVRVVRVHLDATQRMYHQFAVALFGHISVLHDIRTC